MIPTRNGAHTLPWLLKQVRRQEVDFSFELVAIDSGSTDGTVALLRGQVDELVEIRPEQFEHGGTRNLGIQRARGQYVVLMVQDALPANAQWLSGLIRPLRAHHRVAGSFSRQLPHPGATAVAQHYLAQWVATGEHSYLRSLEHPQALEQMSSTEQVRFCAFDNVSACVRRSVWERLPFPRVAIGEDIAWGKQALVAGHQLAFAADSVVFHSHDRSPAYEFWRTYLLHHQLHRLFGLETISDPLRLGVAIGSSMATHLECLRAERRRGRAWVEEAIRAAGLAVAWPLGQYLGARAHRRGHLWRAPGGV